METKTRKDELLLSAPTCMLCAQLRPEEQLVMLGLSELLQPTIRRRVGLPSWRGAWRPRFIRHSGEPFSAET